MATLTPDELDRLNELDRIAQEQALNSPGILSGAVAPVPQELVPAQNGGTQNLPPLDPIREIPNPPQVFQGDPQTTASVPPQAAPPQSAPQAPMIPPHNPDGWIDPGILNQMNQIELAKQAGNAPQAAYTSMGGGGGALMPPGALTNVAPSNDSGGDFMSWAKRNKDVIGAIGTGLLMGDNFKDGLGKGLLLADKVKDRGKLSPKELIELQMRIEDREDRRANREATLQLQRDSLELRKAEIDRKAEEKSVAAQKLEDEKTKALSNAELQLTQVGEFRSLIKDKPELVGSAIGQQDFEARNNYGVGLPEIAGGRPDLQADRFKLYSWIQGQILGDAANMKGALSDKDLAFLRGRVPKLHADTQTWNDFLDEVERRIQANHPNMTNKATPGATGGGENRIRVKFQEQ